MRILLADDEERVRFAMRVSLEHQGGAEIIGEVQDAEELLVALEALGPDLVILDWLLPGLSDIGALPALRVILPDLKVIAVSGRPEVGRNALVGGADAFVSKIDGPECLLEAVNNCRC